MDQTIKRIAGVTMVVALAGTFGLTAFADQKYSAEENVTDAVGFELADERTILGDFVTSDVGMEELPDEDVGTGGSGYALEGAADMKGDNALKTAGENDVLGEAAIGDTAAG